MSTGILTGGGRRVTSVPEGRGGILRHAIFRSSHPRRLSRHPPNSKLGLQSAAVNNMANWPNEEQRQVIEHLHGPVLVLAPVGTGKTTVMAARLARALESGSFLPDQTLCVTFTNRAAGEMRRRVEMALGDRARDANVFTFHGLCAWILRQEAGDLGFAPDLVIYDDADSPDLLEDVYREFGVREKMPKAKEFFWELSQRKSNASPEDLRLAGPPPLFRKEARIRERVAERYHRILDERNALDFADLIHRVRAMVHLLPEKRKRWEERFDWIQVDEVQDTHFSEYDVVSHLAGRTKNLAFFGDIDQTIYEWRGSNPDEVLRQFRRDFGAPTEFLLTRNYRATRVLLKAADRFANSFGKRRTRLVPDDAVERGEKIEIHRANNPVDEARWVARTAKTLARNTGTTKSTVILVRKHERAQVLSRALSEAGVEHVTVEEFEFFRRQEIKDALARLRLILNPADSGSLHRITLRPAMGIGQRTLRKISEEGVPVALRPTDLALPRTHHAGEPFATLLHAWRRGEIVVVDVETTGLSPGRDEVVEVAGVRLREGEPVSTFHRYVQPTLPVGESEKVHGYSDAFLRQKGEDARRVLEEFVAFARHAHIVGHNVRFDLAVLRAHGRRVGIDLRFEDWDDTLLLSRRLVRSDRHDLDTLARLFSLAPRPSHRALDDAHRTAELLARLVPKLAEGSLARARIVAREGRAFAPLAEKVAAWRAQAQAKRPADLLATVLQESGLLDYYRREPRRTRHLSDLLHYFRKSDRTNLDPLSSLQDLTGKVALAKNIELLDPDDRRIPVVT
ncbi:MAG TPA: DNA helicase UvrD, partial [Planctomycetaceae bacterium]|nr:DNA helicase UvrD [Planctomycetaceae bacterium]